MAKKTPPPRPQTFTIVAHVSGNLASSYVFADEAQYQEWYRNALPALEKEHGKLAIRKNPLPGFVPGDHCMVYGEGLDVFEIESLVQYSPYRYGFVLKGHGCEEVAKCFWQEGAARF